MLSEKKSTSKLKALFQRSYFLFITNYKTIMAHHFLQQCFHEKMPTETKKLNWDQITHGSEAKKLSLVFLMQNTRQAIITIESSMIYSLLSKSNIWQYQITLHTNQKHKQIHVDANGSLSSSGNINHTDHNSSKRLNININFFISEQFFLQ